MDAPIVTEFMTVICQRFSIVPSCATMQRMDDIVKQAMAKWPNVPACWGWLGLDARGNWWLRDKQAQACGAFASGAPGVKGARVEHAKLADFIGRNYQCDAAGNWYFQNGPQQVFVALEATPWIWRVHLQAGALHIHSHTGVPLAVATVQHVLMDESGATYLVAPQGVGLVHTQDVLELATALEQGLLPTPQEVQWASLPECYHFVSDPRGGTRASGLNHQN